MTISYTSGETVKSSDDVVSVIEERYKKDETDEFLKPIIIGTDGRIKSLFISSSQIAVSLI